MPRRAASNFSAVPDGAGQGADSHREFEAAADELRVLARLLAFGPEAPLWDDSQERMRQVIQEALRDEDDPLLARALELLAHDGPAVGQLLRHIEEVTSNPPVIIRGQKDIARLMVVPVLVTHYSPLRGFPVERGASFEALASSIKGAGLVSNNATVLLVDYLYNPGELARLLPSQVSRLAQHVLDSKGDRSSSPPPERGQGGGPSQEDLVLDTSMATLCCLLAVVVGAPAAGRAQIALSQEAEDQMMAAIETWAKTAAELLAACFALKSGSVHVLGFDSFFDGLRFALQCFRELSVHTELAKTLATQSIAPKALTVVLCPYGDIAQAREVRVSAVSRLDATLLLGKALPVEGNEDAMETIMRLTRCLRFCGIEDIGVVPEVQLLGQLAKSEEPDFLTPRDVERVSGMQGLPPPEPDEGTMH